MRVAARDGVGGSLLTLASSTTCGGELCGIADSHIILGLRGIQLV